MSAVKPIFLSLKKRFLQFDWLWIAQHLSTANQITENKRARRFFREWKTGLLLVFRRAHFSARGEF